MKKVLIRLISLAMILMMVIPMAIPLYATTSEIEEKEKEQKKLEGELKDTEKQLNELSSLKGNTEAYIKKVDSYLNKLADNIAKLQAQSVAKQQEIDAANKKLAEQEVAIGEQYNAMKKRIQYMYENGNTQYIEMFLASTSMSEFLNRAEYISKITEYDRQQLQKLRDAKEEIAATKAQLESDQAILQATIKETEDEQAASEKLLADKKSSLKDLDAQYAETTDDKAELERQIEVQKQEIAELKAIEEQRRKAAEEAAKKGETSIIYDGGSLMWPLPGYSRISSSFGPRNHPIYNIVKMHYGIDIPAPTGTKIYAAYNGEVAAAKYSSSMGNYVLIDHGNQLYTIYMHQSKMLVSAGDKVKKGDVIGLVGSTGDSTGPHLHFGVRLNGEYVNPLIYVTP